MRLSYMEEHILMGIYLEEVLKDIQDQTGGYWGLDFELVERKDTLSWYIFPRVEEDFEFPDWVYNKRDKLSFLKEI